jgi:glucokinase
MRRIVGVDLGGTWMRVAQIEPASSAPLEPQNLPSPSDWQTFVAELQRHNATHVEGYGLAVSGPIVDHAHVVTAPNLPWLNGCDLPQHLERALGKPVVVANDMEAATAGELVRGSLKDYRWAIFDTISTGWGGCLIVDGRRVDGEPGHANVSFNVSERCGAGHVGCLESLYSGSALEGKLRKRIEATGETVEDVWQYLDENLESDNPWALALVNDWGEGVGRAWANVLNRLRQLEAIVYMGTTAENLLAKPRIVQRLRATISEIAMFPAHRDPFPIRPATYTDRSLYGAVVVYQEVMQATA